MNVEFIREEIRMFIIKELKKTGNGFSSKNFIICNDLANFLRNRYNLHTNWVDGIDFLTSLNIPLELWSAHDKQVIIEQCKIKFGHKCSIIFNEPPILKIKIRREEFVTEEEVLNRITESW